MLIGSEKGAKIRRIFQESILEAKKKKEEEAVRRECVLLEKRDRY